MSLSPSTGPGSPYSSYSTSPRSQSPSLKKVRKQYTLTRRREIWTDEEHSKFVEGLSLYHKDWRRIQQHVATKTVVQVRSHAQKYFMKLNQNAPPQTTFLDVPKLNFLDEKQDKFSPIGRSNSCPSSPRALSLLDRSPSAFSPIQNSANYVQIDGFQQQKQFQPFAVPPCQTNSFTLY
ncbi:hypothetical protein EIN_031250 [Entamoeba invadens IP1]|uniref:Uncharacterized protein n=1 Tax=Entamoeba invadens IP1 TaxID=370355 RepID=A0A0A1TY76_ENTIV|nr:hypothetical protein EIN_031250 [Entamoeba invadens IP1]ELP86424.1 hypothetical protein EIN_031250 [Entamoeba invadens IP1]|eukprot:XP_004185770.1 hypothetical protein EIN_031250 [Entamoeba invadens IP1]